jgi:hypothetical protein
MTIDLTCQKCETSFEVDAQELIDGSEKIICPNCHARAAAGTLDDFVAALVEMRNQVAALAKKFSVNMAIETEDLEDEIPKDDEDEPEESDRELDFDEDEVEEDEDEDERR